MRVIFISGRLFISFLVSHDAARTYTRLPFKLFSLHKNQRGCCVRCNLHQGKVILRHFSCLIVPAANDVETINITVFSYFTNSLTHTHTHTMSVTSAFPPPKLVLPFLASIFSLFSSSLRNFPSLSVPCYHLPQPPSFFFLCSFIPSFTTSLCPSISSSPFPCFFLPSFPFLLHLLVPSFCSSQAFFPLPPLSFILHLLYFPFIFSPSRLFLFFSALLLIFLPSFPLRRQEVRIVE